MTSSTRVQPASGTRRAGSSRHDLEDRARQIDCGRTRDILHSAAVISCGAALYNTRAGQVLWGNHAETRRSSGDPNVIHRPAISDNTVQDR
jgi:hypothetical protein